MCRNGGRYSPGDIASRRRNQDDLNQQCRLCEYFNTDVLSARHGVTQTVQWRVVITVDIRHRTGHETRDYGINGVDGGVECHNSVQCFPLMQ